LFIAINNDTEVMEMNYNKCKKDAKNCMLKYYNTHSLKLIHIIYKWYININIDFNHYI